MDWFSWEVLFVAVVRSSIMLYFTKYLGVYKIDSWPIGFAQDFLLLIRIVNWG